MKSFATSLFGYFCHFNAKIVFIFCSVITVSGCASTWTPVELAVAKDESLCSTFAFEREFKDLIRVDLLSEIDRRQLLRPEIRGDVLKGKVRIGMSKIEAQCTWGDPMRINTTVTSDGSREQWVYSRNYIYFENGKLTAIQQSR